MNASILIVLVVCFVADVSSKHVREVHRRQYGPGGPGGPGGPNGPPPCFLELMTCAAGFVQKYRLDVDPPTAAHLIALTGAPEVCQDALNLKRCVSGKINDATCSSLPPQIRSMANGGLDLIDFLCVEKLQDLTKNWKCLMTPSPAVEKKIQMCVYVSRDRCNVDPVIDCVVNEISKAPTCDAAAGNLVRETITKLLPYVASPCQGQHDIAYAQNVANMVELLWKRK